MECSLKLGMRAELIIGYTARTLDADARAGFARHLETCAECRQGVADQQAVWSALEEWQPVSVSPGFDAKLFERIAQEDSASPWRRMFRDWGWRPAVPVAAALAVLIGTFLLKDPDSAAIPAPAVSQSQASVQIEQKLELALDDMDLLKQIGVDASAERSRAIQ
jgi:anti-sigma-K factor RskA